MSQTLDSPIFTGELTSSTLTITASMGVKRVSVFNSSAVSATVLGSLTLGDVSPSVINVAEGETFTVEAIDASVIKNLTITSPSGCTLKIVAQ